MDETTTTPRDQRTHGRAHAAPSPLIWRLRTASAIRDALTTAFTRKVRIPGQIIADIRGMTYRSLRDRRGVRRVP